MNTNEIISLIDEEIARLQQARAILSTIPSSTPEQIPGKLKAPPSQQKSRTMSAEGRARIAAAQKKRWADKNGGK